jgi:hypothetical protein
VRGDEEAKCSKIILPPFQTFHQLLDKNFISFFQASREILPEQAFDDFRIRAMKRKYIGY